MPLPEPSPRRPSHTRAVRYEAFQRDDGLWDIEGEMRDTKSEVFDIPGEGLWQPGEAIHHMHIRLTLDTAFVVQDIHVAMDSVPHGECPSAQATMRRMVGCSLSGGWRQTIERQLGGVQGCAHLRELLFNMATVAFQALPNAFSGDAQRPPLHLGRCKAWDFDGPLVQKHHPVFFGYQPKSKKPAPPQT